VKTASIAAGVGSIQCGGTLTALSGGASGGNNSIVDLVPVTATGADVTATTKPTGWRVKLSSTNVTATGTVYVICAS
jgi:hypothetical protein